MFFLEIVFFIGGIYAIVTAKVPYFIVGGGFYRIERWLVRTIGALLIIPLPIVYVAYLFGGKSTENVLMLEIVTLFVVGVLVLVLTRVVGRQIEPASDTEAIIAKKTQRALAYAIMSPVFPPIFCPLSLVNANQALKSIDQHGLGEQYRGRAKASRIIAIVLTLLWITACVYWIWAFSL